MKYILIIVIFLIGCNLSCQDNQKKIFLEIKENDIINLEGEEILEVDKLEKILQSILDAELESTKPIIINLSIGERVIMKRVVEVKDILSKFRDKSLVEYPIKNGSRIVKLPPYTKEIPDFTKLKKRNLLFVKVFTDSILVNGKKTTIDELKILSKKFLKPVGKKSNLPEQREKILPKIGKVKCSSKSVVSLQHDSTIVYPRYQTIYELLKQNYDEIWDEYSQKYFKRNFNKLDNFDKKIIKEILPFVLSET